MKKVFTRPVAVAIAAALAITLVPNAGAAPVEVECPAQDNLATVDAVVDTTHIETFDEEKLHFFNQELEAVGSVPLRDGTIALEFQLDGSVVGHYSDGTTYERSPAKESPEFQTYSVMDEIKRVVGACLGVSIGATGFWASIEAELTSWDRAAKFLIRRLGVLGAVSCAGGIIWEYV